MALIQLLLARKVLFSPRQLSFLNEVTAEINSLTCAAQITAYEAKGRPTISSYCIMASLERPCSFEIRDDYTFGVLHYRDLSYKSCSIPQIMTTQTPGGGLLTP